jgi:hypothetical protein
MLSLSLSTLDRVEREGITLVQNNKFRTRFK